MAGCWIEAAARMARLAPVDRQREVEPGRLHVRELGLVSGRIEEAVSFRVSWQLNPVLPTALGPGWIGQVVPVEIVSRGQWLLRAEAVDPKIGEIRPDVRSGLS